MTVMAPGLDLHGGVHIALTVSDVDRSARWYCETFGAVVVADETTAPAYTDEPLRYRGLIHAATLTNLVGLIERSDGGRFDERRTGLDHLAFHVAAPEDLSAWVEHLDRLGIGHSGIRTVDYAHAITFRDPDNIQLEVFWPELAFWAERVTEALGSHA